MPGVEIRSFNNVTDLLPVVNLWRECVPSDPVSEEAFRQKVLLDENFDARGCLVATGGGRLVGFCYTVLRKYPYGARGLEPETGWLQMIFVDPAYRRQGIGTALLEETLGYLASQGRKVCTTGYSPNYIVPGPDEAAHADAIAFLKARGFTVKDDAVAMAGELDAIRTPAEIAELKRQLGEEGFDFAFYDNRYTVPLLDFIDRVRPGGWAVSLRQTLSRGNPWQEVVLCLQGDEVVGYAQLASPLYDPPAGNPERFGPFAVHPDLRGKRIGSVLFYMIAERLRERGFKYLWLAWAHGDNVRFYERAGLRVTRRHLIMERRLGG